MVLGHQRFHLTLCTFNLTSYTLLRCPGVRVAEESGVTEDDLQQIAAELLAKNVHVSIRGTAIRISPNVCVLPCIDECSSCDRT